MQRNIYLFLFLFLLTHTSLLAQFTDDFSDGDFSSNPSWVGEIDSFEVDASNRLHLNANISGSSYLSTQSEAIDNATWEFMVDFDFNPSSSNYAEVHLVANQSDLKGAVNGYYVRVGSSSDDVSLFRNDGGNGSIIINGIDDRIDVGIVRVWVRVTRSATGDWTLETDTTGTNSNYEVEGVVTDATYLQSFYTGVRCVYTSTRSDKMWFDNFTVTGDAFQDIIPPSLSSLRVMSSTELDVFFNEAVEQSSAEVVGNYFEVLGPSSPITASLDPDTSYLVHLTFANPFPNGVMNTLEVNSVADEAGNVMSPEDMGFLYFETVPSEFGDLIFTEIYADPTGDCRGNDPWIPAFEYVELYNTTSDPYDLAGWSLVKLGNSSVPTVVGMPNAVIEPNGYIVLTSQPDTFNIPNAFDVSSFASLNNGGASLRLVNLAGDTIATITYSDDWYADDDSRDGGCSLELINPNLGDCAVATNWTTSISTTGGTPGVQNSVYNINADMTAPELVSMTPSLPDTVVICFNEGIEVGALSNEANYQVDNGLSVLGAIPLNTDNTCVALVLSGSMDLGVIYTITVNGLEDCSGNSIAANTTETVVTGREALVSEVIINEIYVKPDNVVPSPIPAQEFVEIYNRTNDVLSIADWVFSDSKDEVSFIGRLNILAGEYLVICDEDYVADFEVWASGRVVGVDGFPNLNNDKDSVYIRNAFGQNIDFAFYDETWYQDESKEDGGWTLERIDDSFICHNPLNWRASVDENGGTPGEVNSIAGTFEDTEGPRITGIEIVDGVTLEVFFSEPMSQASLTPTANYSIDNGIGAPIVAIPNPPLYQSVALLLNNTVNTANIYTLAVSGLTDCAGNDLTFDTEIQFGIPQLPVAGDVLINEILFDPYTGGDDFVEIYNVSDKVLDLNDIRIGEVEKDINGADSIFNSFLITEQPFLFLPGELICLTKNSEQLVTAYSPPATARFFEMDGFPSFDDSEGGCALITSSDTLDVYFYSDEDHFMALQANDEGISLERLSLTDPTQEAGNWQSSPSSALYATPGYDNAKVYPEFAVGDILVNEILPNPVTGGFDFLEIYNNTSSSIDLSTVAIGALGEDSTITSVYQISKSSMMLEAGSLLCLTVDTAYQKDQYTPPSTANFAEMSRFPSYSDNEGTTFIASIPGLELERFAYLDDYHVGILSDDNGISLERILLTQSASDSENWHSAATTVRATPGYENSQSQETTSRPPEAEDVWLESTTFAPNPGLPDAQSLVINYDFAYIGSNARVRVYDSRGRLIRNLVENQNLGTQSGSFIWDGADNDNNRMDVGVYVILFEVQEENGKKHAFKLACVLADRL